MVMQVKKAKKSVSKPGGQAVETVQATTTVTDKTGAQQTEVEDIGTVEGQAPFANVGISASRTINLGDYNSVKIEISLHVPVAVKIANDGAVEIDGDDLDSTFKNAAEWVDAKMNEKAGEIESQIGGVDASE